VARSEVLYATAFDDALPEDPAARYAEADTRLAENLTAAREKGGNPLVVFPDPYGTFFTPGGVVAEVVTLEHELLAQTA
jgi:regulator of protease activity HflC (stomatin/prohibitin superfamily)